jgi:integrase
MVANVKFLEVTVASNEKSPGGKRRITNRVVDALKSGQIIWDAGVTGFGVRCQRASKVYVLKTRINGRQRWFSIGPHGSPWTPDTARGEARKLLGEVAGQKDPAAARDIGRDVTTVAELSDAFLHDHVDAKRKSRTAEGYRDILVRLANPALGNYGVAEVSRTDVARLHNSLQDKPYQANRVLAVLSKMFAWAEKMGYRSDGTNPCRHVERYPEHKHERFLSDAEMAQLGDALTKSELDGSESPYAIAAIRLLFFTGARLREILTLEWAHVDFENALLRLSDSKTGSKPIYLSAPALETLSGIPRQEGNPFVICGNKPGSHWVALQRPWRRIRERAGLDDVRIHDLRHNYAAVGASGGLSLPIIGRLLGHTQPATTARYAHLSADPVRAANEAIGERISTAMKGQSKNGGEVVILPGRST